ncbi:MAG: cupin domain-containing protein [Polyangiaceae bacterium]|jgi:quercetin dioxygenase-like cupin family protein
MKVHRWQGFRPPDPGAVRAVLEAEGYSAYEWTDDRGTTYPPHTHDDDQSHWVVRGSIALTVDGEEYVLGPGDRDWLPAGTPHSARVVGDTTVTYLVGSKPRA